MIKKALKHIRQGKITDSVITRSMKKLVQKGYVINQEIKGSLVNQGVVNKPFEVVDVPLNSIIYRKGNKGIPYKDRRYEKFISIDVRIAGIIIDGDWDLQDDKESLSEKQSFIDFFIDLEERFVEGKDWEETAYYRDFIDYKVSKITCEGEGKYKTWEVYKEKCLKNWDALYHDIRENGYKRHTEINKKPTDEVEVGVSRKGDVLFFDGIHRVAIAKILGLETIPVIVNIWHRQYIDFIKNAYKINKVSPTQAIKPIINKEIMLYDD